MVWDNWFNNSREGRFICLVDRAQWKWNHEKNHQINYVNKFIKIQTSILNDCNQTFFHTQHHLFQYHSAFVIIQIDFRSNCKILLPNCKWAKKNLFVLYLIILYTSYHSKSICIMTRRTSNTHPHTQKYQASYNTRDDIG